MVNALDTSYNYKGLLCDFALMNIHWLWESQYLLLLKCSTIKLSDSPELGCRAIIFQVNEEMRSSCCFPAASLLQQEMDSSGACSAQ